MKMIEPLPELKKKIEDWVKTKISESVVNAKSQNLSEDAAGKSVEWIWILIWHISCPLIIVNFSPTLVSIVPLNPIQPHPSFIVTPGPVVSDTHQPHLHESMFFSSPNSLMQSQLLRTVYLWCLSKITSPTNPLMHTNWSWLCKHHSTTSYTVKLYIASGIHQTHPQSFILTSTLSERTTSSIAPTHHMFSQFLFSLSNWNLSPSC